MWGTPQPCFPDLCKSATYSVFLSARFQDLSVTLRRERAIPRLWPLSCNPCYPNKLSPWLHWMTRFPHLRTVCPLGKIPGPGATASCLRNPRLPYPRLKAFTLLPPNKHLSTTELSTARMSGQYANQCVPRSDHNCRRQKD